MHELLKHVLNERDLTRAGDIFSIPDSEIVNDLNEVLKQITEISSRPDYCRNDRDQALIEICVTRVTSCVRETGTLEKYCGALVALLESCLHHNLMPLGHLRDDDPPHAKIASDIIACIILVSFPVQADKESNGNKTVMELFLPVAVQFLHKGNREISRDMARYLSLAAVHHANLLKPHVQTIMDSIMSGNYPLCRILTNLYEVSPEPLEEHASALVSLLPHAEKVEKTSLFSLFEQIAERNPDALRSCVPQLLSYLCPSGTSQNDPSCMCIEILQVMVAVSARRAGAVSAQRAALAAAARPPHASPRAVALVATALTQLSYSTKELAQEALNFVLESVAGGRASQAALVREATALCSAYPALFSDRLLAALRPHHSEVNRTSGGVTIVKLGGSQPPPPVAAPPPGGPTYTRRAKLGDSRSTGRLHTGPNSHRSMTRLNVAGGSVGGLHKSMTRLSSSQQINTQQNINAHPSNSAAGGRAAGGGPRSRPPAPEPPPPPQRAHHHNIVIGPATTATATATATSVNTGPTIISGPAPLQSQSISVNPLTGKSTDALSSITGVSIQHSNTALGHVSVINSNATSGPAILSTSCGSGPISVGAPQTSPVSISGPVTVTSRRANNTSVTMINSNSNSNHRISVFEPYPMRDTVQHFCEKHLDKIKAYMDNVSLKLPPPAKCTIEERRSKKQARLQFACGRRGPHCLYARAPFSVRTRAPRVWIHLMFLALQARHAAALSSRDPNVASLKHCWEILKCENKTFLTLVTSAFPGPKEQEMLLNELRAAGFFDVFELSAAEGGGGGGGGGGGAGGGAGGGGGQPTWGCFLCTRPERAVDFLDAAGAPLIEGQLKEKKGRWRLFRRWRTRYFTLSGAHLSCKGASGGESIDINQIRSVKVSRGARNIPKAFEIFTGDQTLILKPKDSKNAEQWAQCLSIAVAHSHAKDVPAKANSLPARGLTLKSF